MKKKVMVLGRFVYGTWYGAMVVFVAVAALLFGLQLANSGFHDIIAWPKGIHIILMLIALVNLGGAMVFSLLRIRLHPTSTRMSSGIISPLFFEQLNHRKEQPMKPFARIGVKCCQ